MAEHGPVPDDTWQLLRDKDVKWICSRLSRAQMTMPPASLDAFDWMWQQRYAQDTPILLDALTRGEQRIAALEAQLSRAGQRERALWSAIACLSGHDSFESLAACKERVDCEAATVCLEDVVLAMGAGADAEED